MRLFVANISQCAEYRQTFCTKNDDYPREYMTQLLQTHLNQYDRFFEGHATDSEAKPTTPRMEVIKVAATRKMSRFPTSTASITKADEASRSNSPSFITSSESRTRTMATVEKERSNAAPSATIGFKASSASQAPDDDDEIELCETMDKVIYPTSATSEAGVGLFIFNSDDHKQGVHVSICQSVGKSCDDFVILRNNYNSMCKQAKIYRELLSLSPEGKPIKERFEFPASCNCVLKRVTTN